MPTIKNYEVNYQINALGNASTFFSEMAGYAAQIEKPLQQINAQIKYINSALKLLQNNKNLQNIFNVKPTIDIESIKKQFKLLETEAEKSAAKISASMSQAMAGVGANGTKQKSKDQIIATRKMLADRFKSISGKTISSVKTSKGLSAQAKADFQQYKELGKQLKNLKPLSKTAQSVINNVQSADALKDAASAVRSLNGALRNYSSRKTVKIKVSADTSPALTAVNTLITTIQEKVAKIPVQLATGTTKGKGKGKGAKASGAAAAAPSIVEQITNGKVKDNALSIKTKFLNDGKLGFDVRQAMLRIQSEADKKPIVIKAKFSSAGLSASLRSAITRLQEIANGKPVVIGASVTSTGTTGSKQTSSSKGSGSSKQTNFQQPINAFFNNRAKRLGDDIKKRTQYADKVRRFEATQQAVHNERAAWYQANWSREALHNQWVARDEAGQSTRAKNIAARERRQAYMASRTQMTPGRAYAMGHVQKPFKSPIQQPTTSTPTIRVGRQTIGEPISYRIAPQQNLYARSRALWYPLTGNTSFGARTPMAVDMIKGMGGMMAIGGAMSGVGSSISQAIKYQNIMRTTNAILENGGSEYSVDAFKNMEQTVRDVGKKTKFTAPQVADAARFLAMAGYDIKGINSAIRPVANIAIIGDTDLGATADKLTNVMTAFDVDPTKMREVADIMTTTFTRSNVDMMMLAESAKYAAPIAHMYGKSHANTFADTMAMFGILGNAGIQASLGGTTIRMMYQNMMKPNKNQTATMKKYGIKNRDANGNPMELSEIIFQIAEKIPEKEMADAIGNMFRITSQPGAAALASHVPDLVKLMQANRDAVGSGISEKISLEKQNTIQGLWYQVTSTFTEGIVQAFEQREGGWAGMLANLRDYLAKPETIKMLSQIVDLVEELGRLLARFAEIWAKIYSLAPGLVKHWMWIQMTLTQVGYLITPIIQLIGTFSTLKNMLMGTATAATYATTVVKGSNAAAAASSIAPIAASRIGHARYRAFTAAGTNAAYMASMGVLNNRKVRYERIANSLKNSVVYNGQREAISPLWFAPMYTFGANPQESIRFMAERSRYGKIDIGQRMLFSDRATAAALRTQAAMDALTAQKAARLNKLRDLRRPYQFADSQLMNRYIDKYGVTSGNSSILRNYMVNGGVANTHFVERYAATGGNAALIYSAMRQNPDAARNIAMNGGKYAKLGWATNMRNKFNAGRMMGAFSLTTSLGAIGNGLKGFMFSLMGGLSKAIGLLVSPAGLAVTAVAALGGMFYKLYREQEQIKKAHEFLEGYKQNVLPHLHDDIQQRYLQNSIELGGFAPVAIGYAKAQEKPEQGYSIADNEIVKRAISGDLEIANGDTTINNLIGNNSFLPKELLDEYYRKYSYHTEGSSLYTSGGTTASKAFERLAQKRALELSVINQWAEMAVNQGDVVQAEKDLQLALKNNDLKKAQDILDAFSPTSQIHMAGMKSAQEIAQISNPTKYYEWQYAQYTSLKNLYDNYVGPLQHYQEAQDIIANMKKNKKEINDDNGYVLAQKLLTATPISLNGKLAQFTLNKWGNIDWAQLARTVNDGIPFTMQQQQELLKNTYDAIYNDPNIKNFGSIIDLLKTYLPIIANEQSPYSDNEITYDWQSVDSMGNKVEKSQTSVPPTLAMPRDWVNTPVYKDVVFPALFKQDGFDRAVKESGGSIMKGTALYMEQHPEKFGVSTSSSTNSIPKNSGAGGSLSGNSAKNQKEYANHYDRSAAKPTQVIINIDNLARFDRTTIAGNADERTIIASIENKVAEAIAMLSSTALTEASQLIAQA